MVPLAVVHSADEVLRRPGVEIGNDKYQEERISQLNDKDVQDGDYVLYWMQEAHAPVTTTPWSMRCRGPTNSNSRSSWSSDLW